MRSALQMLGGVAVAGVVATGSTAFTASGLTNSIAGAPSFIGGKVAQTVIGASLESIVFTNTIATNSPTKTSSFVVTFDGSPNTEAVPDGSVVTVTPTGTAGAASGVTPTSFYCTTTVSQASTCTAGTAVGTYNGYYTALTNLDIQVVAA